MLTLEVAGILGLIGIRDVRRVFLWLVEYLTLAGPCPFLLVLVSHCPGWVRFFEILVFISLLSSNISYFRKLFNSSYSTVKEIYFLECVFQPLNIRSCFEVSVNVGTEGLEAIT